MRSGVIKMARQSQVSGWSNKVITTQEERGMAETEMKTQPGHAELQLPIPEHLPRDFCELLSIFNVSGSKITYKRVLWEGRAYLD